MESTSQSPRGNNRKGRYHYDGLFRRITKVVGTTTRELYYNTLWQCIEERLGTTTPKLERQYSWDLEWEDNLILREIFIPITGSPLLERDWAIHDGKNITGLFQKQGGTEPELIQRYSYSAFGIQTVLNADFAPTDNWYLLEYGYCGYRLDIETKLNYVRFRFYSSSQGIWLSRDPLYDAFGFEIYSYLLNSPFSNWDPLGLSGVGQTHAIVGPIRVDSEVIHNKPAGGVHIQDLRQKDKKWFYNTKSGQFLTEAGERLPKNIEEEFKKNRKLRNAVRNACNRVNLGGGFAEKHGGGKAIIAGLALSFVGLLTIEADAIEYLEACERDDLAMQEIVLLRMLQSVPGGSGPQLRIKDYLMQAAREQLEPDEEE